MPSKELIEKVASHFEFPDNATTLVTAENILLDILAALQEPTEGMMKSGLKAWRECAGDIEVVWLDMLAASALGEQAE